MGMLVENRAQYLVALGGADLRVGGIDVDVDGRPARPFFEGDAVHAPEVDEEVGLTHERHGATRAGAVLRLVHGVDEDPVVAEPEGGEEAAGGAQAVVVGFAELAGRRVVGRRVVGRVLVEPDVVAERAEPEEVVRGLPGVAADRVPDEVAREDDARHRTAS